MTGASRPRALTIAIDGPSGVGKGTVSRTVAGRLGYRHVDTGAMYRAVAWKAVQNGIDLDDEAAVASLCEDAIIEIDGGTVHIDGLDVTRAIRTPEIDKAATSVARMPQVRARLVARQRALAASGGIVMEGRDIGTVVLPGADLKIYLDAAPDERARRRANDPAHGGPDRTLDSVATALADRDRQDQTRAASPLYKADDAVLIDTTAIDVDHVIAEVMALVEKV